MKVPLTSREIEYVLGWKEKSFWPDEERIIRKLRVALDTSEELKLSFLQVRIIYGWVEENIGGHFGSRVVNGEENSLLQKLELILEQTPKVED